jgi:hypothetical protein
VQLHIELDHLMDTGLENKPRRQEIKARISEIGVFLESMQEEMGDIGAQIVGFSLGQGAPDRQSVLGQDASELQSLAKRGGRVFQDATSGIPRRTASSLSCGIFVERQGRGGCAIVVNLEKANILGCEVPHPHCTVLFRKSGRFSEMEFREVIAYRGMWLAALGRPPKAADGGVCTFDASEPWGANSNKISGELAQLVTDTREHFQCKFGLVKAEQRLPHVQMRAQGRSW